MRRDGTLRILLLSTEYPPETGWGGIGTYTCNIAHALTQRGHEVHVLSVAPRQKERHYRDAEVYVHRFPHRELWKLRRLRPAPMPLPHLEQAMSTYLSYRRLSIDFDIIEYPEWLAEGLFFPLLQPKPTVAHLHTSLALNTQVSGLREGVLGRLAAFLEGISIGRADMITSPSQALLDWTTQRFRLKNARALVIPHPFPIGQHPPIPTPPEDSPEGEVLFVGRMQFKKNPEVIIRAAESVREKIPQAHFTFVGGTSVRGGVTYREWLSHLAAAHGVANHVRFTGHLPHQEIDALQRAASVIVVPSRWENFPYVLLEAMMAARPIVAGRAGGIPEIIRDGETGLLVDPDDTQGWVEALVALLCDHQWAWRMGQQARKDAIARFHPSKIAARRAAAYRDALAIHRARHQDA
jgi:glycogen(starch) synthase